MRYVSEQEQPQEQEDAHSLLLLLAAPAPFCFFRVRAVRHLGAPACGHDGVAACRFLPRSKPRLGCWQ